MWVLDVYEETELLWYLMVKVKSSSKCLGRAMKVQWSYEGKKTKTGTDLE